MRRVMSWTTNQCSAFWGVAAQKGPNFWTNVWQEFGWIANTRAISISC
jgi:hypothetical protein